ncbi:MAG: T9SS type A sorting domain-containing protein, partial [Ignavibacterium sp.]
GEGTLVTLKVYDILGNEVATLVEDFIEAGRHEVEFNAENLSAGMYLLKLNSGSFQRQIKMLYLK